MRTISSRLQLSIGGLALVIIAFVVIYFPIQQRARQKEAFESQLHAIGDSFAITIGIALEGKSYAGMRQASKYVQNDPGSSVVITTAEGQVFAAYPPEAAKSTSADGDGGADSISYRAVAAADESGQPTHYVTLTKSLEPVNQEMRREQLQMLAIGACLFALAVGVIRMISRGIAVPIETLSQALIVVADGKLSTRVDLARRGDEIGSLATGFNDMVGRLHELATSVRDGMAELNDVAGGLGQAASGMVGDLTRQRDATQTVSVATGQVSDTAREVNQSADSLASSIQESSASLSQMNSATHLVSENMDGLIEALDGASSGTTEMATSVAQIAETMETLSGRTREVEGLLQRVSSAIRDVDESAKSCGTSSKDVTNEAARGAQVVEETTEAMQKVRQCFDDIQERVGSLEQKARDVDRIVEMISKISEETALLSLNASIIAAQAGEHGAGFGVVAGQIQVLSARTAESAKEVAAIVGHVRTESANTAEAVSHGASAVDQGFERSRDAGQLLIRITEKAKSSAERVDEIVSATGIQAGDIVEVEKAMSLVRELAQQTSEATQEQTKVGASVSRELEQIRALGLETRRTTHEQRGQTTHVTRTSEQILSEMGEIVKASETQVSECDNVSTALSIFSQIAQDGEQRAETCQASVEKLLDRARHLQAMIDRFEL